MHAWYTMPVVKTVSIINQRMPERVRMSRFKTKLPASLRGQKLSLKEPPFYIISMDGILLEMFD